jgi:hypothetical protein
MECRGFKDLCQKFEVSAVVSFIHECKHGKQVRDRAVSFAASLAGELAPKAASWCCLGTLA